MKRTLIIAATLGLSTLAYSQASKTAPTRATGSAKTSTGAVTSPSKVNAAGSMSIQAIPGISSKASSLNSKALPSFKDSFSKSGSTQEYQGVKYYQQELGQEEISVDGDVTSSEFVGLLETALEEAGYTFENSEIDAAFVEAVSNEISKDVWADPSSLAATKRFVDLFMQAKARAESESNSEAIANGENVLKTTYFDNARQTGYAAQAAQCFL